MASVKVIIEKSNQGFSAYLPELQGCICTSDHIDPLKKELEKAIEFHLAGMREDHLQIPEVFQQEYSLEYTFDVETFLNYYHHIFTRRALSRITGINESLLSQYATGIKQPRQAQSKKIETGLHQLAKELLQIRL